MRVRPFVITFKKKGGAKRKNKERKKEEVSALTQACKYYVLSAYFQAGNFN